MGPFITIAKTLSQMRPLTWKSFHKCWDQPVIAIANELGLHEWEMTLLFFSSIYMYLWHFKPFHGYTCYL